MRLTIMLILAVLLTRCSPKPSLLFEQYVYVDQGNEGIQLSGLANDESYGYSASNPIKIGGEDLMTGPYLQRLFLNSLAGPEGQPLKYMRIGSCCSFESERGINGIGLLDKYQVSWDGQKEPVILYLNMYDTGAVQAPVGFTVRI
ncbi:MAG: hypothetical protein P8X57_16255 [Cyclobacteriaceae bacterium]